MPPCVDKNLRNLEKQYNVFENQYRLKLKYVSICWVNYKLTFMSNRSRTCLSWKAKMPSKMITFAPYIGTILSSRRWVTKLYIGTLTSLYSFSLFNVSKKRGEIVNWSFMIEIRGTEILYRLDLMDCYVFIVGGCEILYGNVSKGK